MTSTQRVHVPALDGLRGIAAVTVVLRHTFNAIAMDHSVREGLLRSPLALILNAQAAVQLFFVLSGWVLAASLARSSGRGSWALFGIRRVFRIHPPYVFAVLFAWAASTVWTHSGSAGVTTWLMKSAIHPEPARVAAALVFPGNATGLLPVGWTLRIEMIYSLVMPLLAIAAPFARGLPLLAVSALLLAGPWTTGWYLLDFAFGVVAFEQRDGIARVLRAVGGPGRALLLLAGAFLYTYPVAFGDLRPSVGILRSGFSPSEIAMMAVGSAVFVACAATAGGFARTLSLRPFLFLGLISYSLYLLHRTVLTFVAPRVLAGTILGGATITSAILLYALVFGISISISVAAHRLVERPSIALGNHLCRRLAARLRVRATDSHAAELA